MSDSSFRPDADEQWEALLQQWRARPEAQPRPFFYQRVRARLAEKEVQRPWWPVWLRRPAYAALLGLLGVALSGDCAALRAADDAPVQKPDAGGQLAPLLGR